jgi:hypothetical protein
MVTFDYNTTRKKLILSEYGRNVQNIVDYICTLPTKEERNKYAKVVIDMMGFLNPHLRDVADFKHKLWDHLHIISDFKIEVDSPYPKPSKDAIHIKPAPLKYPHQNIRRRHYGKTIELMIERAIALDDDMRKQHMIQGIINFMKNAYVIWNKESVTEDIIISDLQELSGGKLTLEGNANAGWGEFQRRNVQRNSNSKTGGKTRTWQNKSGTPSNNSDNKRRKKF